MNSMGIKYDSACFIINLRNIEITAITFLLAYENMNQKVSWHIIK